jgi:Arc/MetJ-type ribon-helix-helix transcriptional regulator
MPAIEQLVIDLPADVADLVRSRMASGKYANESAVIEEALIDTTLPPIHADDLDEWIRTEGVRRYDAMRADPSQGMTHEEFWAAVESDEKQAGKER